MNICADTYVRTVQSHSGIRAVFDRCSRGVPRKHHQTLQAATGFLFDSSFLDNSRTAIRRATPQDRTRVLDMLVDDAVERLSDAGLLIVPAWWTLAYWVFRWVVLPYLYDLLAEYTQSDVRAGVIVSRSQS